jgi:uncharacterized protein (TIGR00255 family)
MTGYGRGAATVERNTSSGGGSKTINVEVRSLNSKGLDLNVKLPAAYRSLEPEVRNTSSAIIGRGKTDIFIGYEDNSSVSGARINNALFGEYLRQIRTAARETGLPITDEQALIPSILRMPDVMTSSEDTSVPEAEIEALRQALRQALTGFDTFRAQEGAVLMADLIARVDSIESLLTRVAPLEAARVPAVKARILENIAAVGVTVDANRLEQEIVFWVEKLDITEEKVRLTKHCDYFRSTVASDEDGVGRKLGFIAQEMGREINTLGSKANDAAIQRLVVQMKDELEKIKEQLLNIL